MKKYTVSESGRIIKIESFQSPEEKVLQGWKNALFATKVIVVGTIAIIAISIAMYCAATC